MRRFSREEFRLELERRGCHCVAEEDDLGTFWLGPDGRHFQVPPPEADDRHPEFLLDDLILHHGLPRTPRRRR
ncbi:MAG TPA: hypothetical protein VHW66_04980 [Stellaceae bacterium]|nr:hypothetical protein [Stellaceae bacterium]